MSSKKAVKIKTFTRQILLSSDMLMISLQKLEQNRIICSHKINRRKICLANDTKLLE